MPCVSSRRPSTVTTAVAPSLEARMDELPTSTPSATRFARRVSSPRCVLGRAGDPAVAADIATRMATDRDGARCKQMSIR
jgi:hypothetical protein